VRIAAASMTKVSCTRAVDAPSLCPFKPKIGMNEIAMRRSAKKMAGVTLDGDLAGA